MATPRLAGSAAIVIQQHPDWDAWQVRSAIVNTAERSVLGNYQTNAPTQNVTAIGAGRENLYNAVTAGLAPLRSTRKLPYEQHATEKRTIFHRWLIVMTLFVIIC